MEENRLIKIFIVDDNKAFALLLKGSLESSFPDQKFDISIFESGEASVNALDIKPDLAIVDYHLNSEDPNAMNGIDVIDSIREKCPKTDFIMITMDQRTELFLRSKEHDIYDYLTKSSNISFKLTLSVSQWLKLKR